MELQFLGTGAGIPSKQRNVSSICLSMLQERQTVWMFDCGEGTQHQLLHSNLKARKIEKIFITHLHGDHIYGLPGLLASRSFQSGELPVTIYGPTGIKDYVETSLRVSGTHLSYPVSIIEIESGVIFADEQFTVEALPLKHGIASFGYLVSEKDAPGELMPDRLKQAGISPGPIYRQIKENAEIELEDGTVLYRQDFIGPDKQGRKIAILGDTTFIPELASELSDADVIVHEATFRAEEAEMAYQYGHSTTVQAAEIAKAAHAGELLLTHISARYQNGEEQLLQEEAAAIFPNTKIASDLAIFPVNKNEKRK